MSVAMSFCHQAVLGCLQVMSYLIIELPLGIRYLITKLPIDMSYLVTQLLPSYCMSYLAALMFKVLYTSSCQLPSCQTKFLFSLRAPFSLSPYIMYKDNSGYILYSTHSTVQYITVYTIQFIILNMSAAVHSVHIFPFFMFQVKETYNL